MVPGPDGRAEWRRGRGRAGRTAWCARGSRAREQATGRASCRKSRERRACTLAQLSHRPRVDLEPLLLGYDTTPSLRGQLARTWRRTPRPPHGSVEGSLRRETSSLPRRSARAGTVPLGGEDSCHSLPTCPAPTDIVPVVEGRERPCDEALGGRAAGPVDGRGTSFSSRRAPSASGSVRRASRRSITSRLRVRLCPGVGAQARCVALQRCESTTLRRRMR